MPTMCRYWLACVLHHFARAVFTALACAPPVLALYLLAGPTFTIIATTITALWAFQPAKKPKVIVAKPSPIPVDSDFEDAYRAMAYWRERYLVDRLTTDQLLLLHELIDWRLLKVVEKNYGLNADKGWANLAINHVTAGGSLVDFVTNKPGWRQTSPGWWVTEGASEQMKRNPSCEIESTVHPCPDGGVVIQWTPKVSELWERQPIHRDEWFHMQRERLNRLDKLL